MWIVAWTKNGYDHKFQIFESEEHAKLYSDETVELFTSEGWVFTPTNRNICHVQGINIQVKASYTFPLKKVLGCPSHGYLLYGSLQAEPAPKGVE